MHRLSRNHPGAPTITLQPGDDVTCTLNNNDILVPVSIAKADGAVTQLADGTWSISYEVVVTNTSATLPTTYSLTDTPAFDSSFTISRRDGRALPTSPTSRSRPAAPTRTRTS